MSHKRKTMCQLIFIVKQSSCTTTLLLVGTCGAELVPCRTAQWLEQVWPCRVGGARRQLGARPPHCRVWGEAVPAWGGGGGGPQNRVFYLFLLGELRAPGECGKSINRNQGGGSKLCHFVSNSHVSPTFLQPLLSG
uniref:Secreted protein n=1 Tax=Pipistrellus kuhlii TaxID=59472 RepID=A0A7J7S6C1_PIPKU|nr:hypothetical protein mPipKuh1_010013 [Pipistrellus kuhlii]